jgi:epsilon-lactone hydrolase
MKSMASHLNYIKLIVLLTSLLGSSKSLMAENPPASPLISQKAAQIYNSQLSTITLTSLSMDSINELRSTADFVLHEKLKDLNFEVKETKTKHCGISSVRVSTGNTSNASRILLFLHGGAYVFGSSYSNAVIPALMSKEMALPVLSINYRLAPESPFPGAIKDVITCYEGLLKLGFRSTHIALFGDSAGAGLALASTLEMRSKGLPLPAVLGLFSPWVDLSEKGDSRAFAGQFDPLLSTQALDLFAGLYAGKQDRETPLLSPIYAELWGMPPMIIHAGSRDLLLSDAIRLARKVRMNGGKVELDIWDGMWHVWQLTPELDETRESIVRMAQFFEKYLAH